MKEKTIFQMIGGKWCAKLPNVTMLIVSSSQLIKDMMQTCEMFRIIYCGYCVRWYKKNNKKAELEVTQITSYETKR